VCGRVELALYFDLAECPSCTHIFQADLTPTIDYQANYGKTRYELHSTDMSYLRAGYILSRVPGPGTALDIGYGNGLFLKVMKRAGWGIYGLDVHGKDYGVPEAPALDRTQRYTIATFFDSLEHIADLDIVLKVHAEHVFISIPHRPDRFREYFAGWRHYRPGEHLHYFSSTSLKALMRQCRYQFVSESAIEDTIRGKCWNTDNVHTFHFKAGA
jgi:hypothetical protein